MYVLYKRQIELDSYARYVARRTGQFFLEALSHLCPKFFSTAPEKTAMLTCKIVLPDSPHPVIILLVKIPDFGHFICLDGMNYSVFLFTKYKFSFLAAGFCPNNNDFARVRGEGLQPPAPLTPTTIIRGVVVRSVQGTF